MPLHSTSDMVKVAAAQGRGVGAFNVILLEHAEALVAGATMSRAPVILQISENAVKYHGALEPIGAATLAVARAASIPVAVHLDHAESIELVHEAVDLGFTSVMYDGSKLPYEQNVLATAEVAAYCHEHGVGIEAELGEIGGKDGVHAPGARTQPSDAAAFIAATGVDALAVAVGSSHAMLTRDASLDFELISELRDALPVPLVLHGSSGVSDANLVRAIQAGMTKINIGTHLNHVFTDAARTYLADNPTVVDPRKYVGAGRAAITTEVARITALLHEPAPR